MASVVSTVARCLISGHDLKVGASLAETDGRPTIAADVGRLTAATRTHGNEIFAQLNKDLHSTSADNALRLMGNDR